MDLRAFYMMNGQIIFADYLGVNEDTGDYSVKGAVQVMIGQNKQIGMSTAFPFTHIDEEISINSGLVTSVATLDWNKGLVREYDNFWSAIRKKVAADASGIEVVPANAVPKNVKQAGPPRTHHGPTIVRG